MKKGDGLWPRWPSAHGLLPRRRQHVRWLPGPCIHRLCCAGALATIQGRPTVAAAHGLRARPARNSCPQGLATSLSTSRREQQLPWCHLVYRRRSIKFILERGSRIRHCATTPVVMPSRHTQTTTRHASTARMSTPFAQPPSPSGRGTGRCRSGARRSTRLRALSVWTTCWLPYEAREGLCLPLVTQAKTPTTLVLLQGATRQSPFFE